MKIALISTDFYIYSHGLRSISSYLKENGHETVFISMPYPIVRNEKIYETIDYTKLYPKNTIKNLQKIVKGCDLIGISSMAITFKRTLQLINGLKPLNIPLVWGGVFPTTFPQECINHCNILCIGEGEEAFLELANQIEAGKNISKIQNLWIKNENDKIIKNPLRKKIEYLDKLPNYDYTLETNYILEPNGKFSKLNQTHIGKWLFYHSIRGCIYTCKFCCNHQLDALYQGLGMKIRKKSINLVIKELEELIKKFPHVKNIWFTDDDMNMRTLEELEEFKELYKKKINLPFRCYMSATTVTEQKLRLLIESGLKHIEFGVQTGSDRINREIYGRSILKKNILKAAKIVNRYKKYIEPSRYQFITTNPYEKKEDLLETIDLIIKLPAPYEVQTFGLVFFPGSPLYEKAIEDKYIRKFEDSGYDLDYTNREKHLKIKNKNFYLNSLIHWMSGNGSKNKCGLVPKSRINFLTKDSTINFFEKNQLPIKMINLIVQIMNLKTAVKARIGLMEIKRIIYNSIPKKIKNSIKKHLGIEEKQEKYLVEFNIIKEKHIETPISIAT